MDMWSGEEGEIVDVITQLGGVFAQPCAIKQQEVCRDFPQTTDDLANKPPWPNGVIHSNDSG